MHHEDRPPTPAVQDLANQVADLLRRSAVQYPGLSTAELLQALTLAVRQARPDTAPGRARPTAALLMGVMAAAAGAGIVVWRSGGGSFSAVQIAALGALVLAVIAIVRRFTE